MTNRNLKVMFAGLAVGAIAAAFLDPRRGAARRAKLRDKFIHFGHLLEHQAIGRSIDWRQRARGRLYEVRHKRERVEDDILVERVRAQIGKRVSNMHSLVISADNGRVIIAGPVKATERAGLIDILHKTRGVVDVDIRPAHHREIPNWMLSRGSQPTPQA